jgi:putative endonuclease
VKITGHLRAMTERIGTLWDFGIFSLAGLDRMTLGRRGERIAERHLRRRGYRILERNFRAAGAEIDLVALDGDTLVFVEVKTRRTAGTGEPAEAVNFNKQSHLRRAAELYAMAHRAQDRAMRFDVVAIEAGNARHHLELLRDAF